MLTMTGSLGEDVVPAMLAASPLVVVQRAKMFSRRADYDVYAPDGTPYGSVHQAPGSGASFFGQLATISYEFVAPDGQLLLRMVKPANIFRARFDVAWGSGQPIGTIRQQNLLFAPQFALQALDGTARLVGGTMLSWEWRLEDAAGRQVGAVNKKFAGVAELFTTADKFVVHLAPHLTGALRALAVAATVCLDEVRTARRRR